MDPQLRFCLRVPDLVIFTVGCYPVVCERIVICDCIFAGDPLELPLGTYGSTIRMFWQWLTYKISQNILIRLGATSSVLSEQKLFWLLIIPHFRFPIQSKSYFCHFFHGSFFLCQQGYMAGNILYCHIRNLSLSISIFANECNDWLCLQVKRRKPKQLTMNWILYGMM